MTQIKCKNILNDILFSSRSFFPILFLFTISGAIQLSAQPLNNHLIFDGVDDYISLNNMDVAGSAMTLEALINSSDLSNCPLRDCRIISKATGLSTPDHYWMLSTNNSGANTVLRFRLKTNGTSTTLMASTGPLSDNTWYHVAATYDGSTMKLFLNGTEVGSTPKTGALTTNSAISAYIGGNPPGIDNPWRGAIDEVRIWNTARTQAQLQANSNVELSGNEAGLQTYYKFNEGTGQTINDQAGNNNTVLGSTNSTDTNDPTFAISNPVPAVNIKVLLEGTHDSSLNEMTNILETQNLIPNNQPFNQAPWNYNGTETKSISQVTDWVLVSFRTDLAGSTEIARAAGLLRLDGQIHFPSPNVLPNNLNTPVYIVIETRNHLTVMSPQPVAKINGILTYDFSTADSYTSSGRGQKQMTNGKWVLFSGDINNDLDINGADRVLWAVANGSFGAYLSEDLNLNGDVTGDDRIYWAGNNGVFSTVPASDTLRSNAVVNCPIVNFELDNCNYTVTWIHDNPVSTAVNYDLRVNGIDPGPSVTYPMTSNTIDICNLLGITSGTGSFDIELLYWYDGDNLNQISAGICTINYDLGSSPPTHAQGKTFAQIAAGAHSNFCVADDESYIAEYLYQHPTVCFWEVQTLNGVKCVVPLPDPVLPANATVLPAPTGGDDTNMLNTALNSGGSFNGLNRTYRISRLVHTAANMQLFNITLKPVAGATQLIHVQAPGVLHYNVNIDGENQASVYQCIRILDSADDYTGVKGSAINTWHKKGAPGADNLSGGVYRIGLAENFHIAGNSWKDHRNDVEQKHDVSLPTVASCRGVWMVSNKTAPVPNGVIANNYCENLQSNGNREDAEFFVVQGYAGSAPPLGTVKVYANRCEDAGKRLTKCQDGGVAVYSNSYWWKTLQGDLTSENERQMRTVLAVHLGVSNVHFENNRILISQPRFAHVCVWNDSVNGPHSDNLTFNCNEVIFAVPHNNGNSGGGEMFFFDNITPSSTTGSEPTNSSISNNRFMATNGGNIKHYYWLRYGYANVIPWPGLTFTGNVENVPATVSRFKF